MKCERPFDPVLEEMWAIKREIASEYPSLDAYFQGVLDEQELRARQGVKFVSFPPRIRERRRPLARRGEI